MRPPRFPLAFALAILAAALSPLAAAELRVGPGQKYANPSAAAAAARDGDTVTIAAGVYAGDVCRWRANRLTLRGAGAGKTVIEAAGKICEGKAIWIIGGNDTVVEGVAFAGASCPDKNGAGIRLEGRNLTVRGCFFRDNENGILTGPSPDGDLLVEDCEFAGNGAGDGYSHNLYIGAIRRLVFRGNYSHHARQGHQLKSRARENLIFGNRFADGADGQSSYLVDLPNGGRARLVGNLLEQGPRAANGVLFAFARETPLHPATGLEIRDNVFVNRRPAGEFVALGAGAPAPELARNSFIGAGTLPAGADASAQQALSLPELEGTPPFRLPFAAADGQANDAPAPAAPKAPTPARGKSGKKGRR